ncbi:unnamed protein product [Cuscuta epithymum]|uniref:Uncharacterized protein n=1 Tax=Cuscuta epithymum TaxID=186058 RepID=A0AAV0CQX2_9ASTE|nr:unnamed protein product [Cuscuta epithymum]
MPEGIFLPCFMLGALGVLFFPLLGFFPTGFFLVKVFNEAPPHNGQGWWSPGRRGRTLQIQFGLLPFASSTLDSGSGGLLMDYMDSDPPVCRLLGLDSGPHTFSRYH